MFTNMKRRTALLLSAAVLCSVTVVMPTANAAASVLPNTGVGADVYTAPSAGPDAMDACPGTTASEAVFTDVTANADVNCLAMFNITLGKTATTYDPTGTISRQDMARYIHRMFVPTGMAAAGLTVVPAFTDIGHVTAEGVLAINALASHGITLGTSATAYSPDDNVTREQMAMFLNRFASIAKDHAGVAITAVAAATGNYNYSDITTATWEGMESIIRLFNLGVADGTCTAGVQYVTAGTCLTTYRPSEDITRLEMAGMVHRLLSLTNARPAGLSMQSTTATVLVGAESPLISMRNADFSPQANTIVDEFYQLHNDAAGVAAQAPFDSLSGVCSSNVSKTAGSTKCYMDANDASTDVRGNITGTSQTTAAYKTANWWVHTGASGTQYVDGTTSGHYLYTIAFGAAATATVFADRTTYSSTAGLATVTSKAGDANVTGNDGITTYVGESRTFTATQILTASPLSPVVSGYTFKVVTHKVDVNGNVTNSTAYYPSSAGTASWTVTCSADDSALTTTWWESYELTVTMSAADGGTGLPVGAGNPLAATVFGTGVGGHSSTLNVTCLDDVRAYAAAQGSTLSISDNNYTISAAGSLGSATATAYDQYGAGIAGVPVRISSNTDGGGVVTRANLTTAANGTATLSAVVCATGIETVAWSVVDPGSTNMDAVAASVPSSLTTEGTTMYCSTAKPDGVIGDLSAVAEVQTVVMTAAATDLGGNVQYTYGGQTTAAIAFGVNAAGIGTAMDNLSTLEANAVEGATTATSGAIQTVVFTFHTNWGNASAIGCVVGALTGTAPITCVVTQGAEGVPATTVDFLDDNPGTSTVLTKVTEVKAVGAASATAVRYETQVYDSGDAFNIGAAAVATAVTGATMAEFAAALLAETGTTIELQGSLRTGALTTGVSSFQLG